MYNSLHFIIINLFVKQLVMINLILKWKSNEWKDTSNQLYIGQRELYISHGAHWTKHIKPEITATKLYEIHTLNGIKTRWWTPFHAVLYNIQNLIDICNMFYLLSHVGNTSPKINSKLNYCIDLPFYQNTVEFAASYAWDLSYE